MAKSRTINTIVIAIRNENRNYATKLAAKIEYKNDITTLIDIEKYSCLYKLYCVTASVYRFKGNLKNHIKNKHENLLERPLTREEIKHTEHIWMKALQEKHSAADKFIKLKSSLKLFIVDNGILRCRSCLCEAENLSFNHCNPIYIRHEEHFVKLVILKAHNHVCHSGVESTLNQLRTKYWIAKERQKMKTILKTCVICRLCQGKPCLPPASPLSRFI